MTKRYEGKQFTYLDMEAALCVWECLNDWTLLDSNMSRPEWVELRDNIGSVEMRHQSIALGQWCLAIYDACKSVTPDIFDMISYDWDVIPMILGFAEKDGKPLIYEADLPSVADVAKLIPVQMAKDEWMNEARAEAMKQWCYPGLIDDHAEATAQALRDNESPSAFVKWLGEKHGLEPVCH